MTERLPDWQARLIDVVEAHLEAPFAWGTHDCLLFAGRCVEAVTGESPIGDLPGSYGTAKEAAALVRERGFRDLAEALAFHFEAQPAGMARRGDLGIATVADGPAIVVCLGDRWAGPREPAGLTYLPLAAVASAFRVG